MIAARLAASLRSSSLAQQQDTQAICSRFRTLPLLTDGGVKGGGLKEVARLLDAQRLPPQPSLRTVRGARLFFRKLRLVVASARKEATFVLASRGFATWRDAVERALESRTFAVACAERGFACRVQRALEVWRRNIESRRLARRLAERQAKRRAVTRLRTVAVTAAAVRRFEDRGRRVALRRLIVALAAHCWRRYERLRARRLATAHHAQSCVRRAVGRWAARPRRRVGPSLDLFVKRRTLAVLEARLLGRRARHAAQRDLARPMRRRHRLRRGWLGLVRWREAQARESRARVAVARLRRLRVRLALRTMAARLLGRSSRWPQQRYCATTATVRYCVRRLRARAVRGKRAARAKAIGRERLLAVAMRRFKRFTRKSKLLTALDAVARRSRLSRALRGLAAAAASLSNRATRTHRAADAKALCRRLACRRAFWRLRRPIEKPPVVVAAWSMKERKNGARRTEWRARAKFALARLQAAVQARRAADTAAALQRGFSALNARRLEHHALLERAAQFHRRRALHNALCQLTQTTADALLERCRRAAADLHCRRNTLRWAVAHLVQNLRRARRRHNALADAGRYHLSIRLRTALRDWLRFARDRRDDRAEDLATVLQPHFQAWRSHAKRRRADSDGDFLLAAGHDYWGSDGEHDGYRPNVYEANGSRLPAIDGLSKLLQLADDDDFAPGSGPPHGSSNGDAEESDSARLDVYFEDDSSPRLLVDGDDASLVLE